MFHHPITAAIQLHAPVKCARTECPNLVADQQQAVFVVRHIMCVAYCCPGCYLETWRAQLDEDRLYRQREEVLDSLGYYEK